MVLLLGIDTMCFGQHDLAAITAERRKCLNVSYGGATSFGVSPLSADRHRVELKKSDFSRVHLCGAIMLASRRTITPDAYVTFK